MHVASTHISKANVCPYLGKEIPGWDALGLNPEKIYRLYRDPAELEKGAATFNNLPLLRKHIQVSADAPMKDDVVGSIGSDVAFNTPYLDASLCVWDAEAIALIESGALEELSSAYHYTPVMEPGVASDGEKYDGRMTDILGNHLALVTNGRAGPDVVVADSNPFPKLLKASAMKKTKLGRALMVALSAASPKIAQDSALLGLVGGAVGKTFDRKGVSAQLCAMDADLEPEKADEIIDAVLGVEDNPEPIEPKAATTTEPPKAQDAAGDLAGFLKGKGLSDEDIAAACAMAAPGATDEAVKPEDVDAKVEEGVKTAMDSMRVEFKQLEAAKAAVRSTVGDLIGMDSAEAVYRFALDHLKVAHKDMPAAGLGTLFTVAVGKPAATARPLAMDSAAAAAQFPGLARFTS